MSSFYSHVYLSSNCTGTVTLGIFVRLCGMCTSDVRLWSPYHIRDQDAECYYDPTGAGEVPRGNNIHTLPYRDVGQKNENDREEVAHRDNDGAPHAQ